MIGPFFSETLTDENRKKLLSDIYSSSREKDDWCIGYGSEDVEDVQCAIFYDNIITNDDKSSLWERFCLEIKTHNRFILDFTSDVDFVDLLNSKRIKLKAEDCFFMLGLVMN
ncbi:hypothetical protein [Paenibacillus rhizophilus]|uniref:Uncharacterized protein n=1 Tax=Paenibacillus rhizophilus TaxID=1850366 RepID=A0A3N9P1J3_9BACL|nr:hypothetical protein [Paenibacillus rhizophilus]RQW09357.1 hypothetical protein EH198_19485 [Paenibacillus rhizophilus]